MFHDGKGELMTMSVCFMMARVFVSMSVFSSGCTCSGARFGTCDGCEDDSAMHWRQ